MMAPSIGDAVLKMPDGRVISIPVLKDNAGAEFLDVRSLQPKHGVCTYDPGFTSTGSCESSITYIDGVAGVLLYRGYDIAELAEERDFYDVAHLLVHGELPDAEEKEAWHLALSRHTLVHETLIQFFKGYKHDAHPMAIMVGTVGALSAFYPSFNFQAFLHEEDKVKFCVRMIAKMPTLAAIAYKTAMGQPYIYPRNDLGYAENFLYMMFAVPSEPYTVDPVLARALEVIIILHMDHEQNASTSTVRTAGSSQANPFACIASGVAALWGPAHGGANEAVLAMLTEIGTVARIPQCLARAKDKADPFRLMGFGHRVYKSYDPRAKIMKGICHKVLAHLGRSGDQLLEVAVELEKIALSDEYFVKRSLYPNVDFYSGIVLRAMGIPVTMYTVLFAVARTVGWVAQWKEMASQKVPKITRPRQLYTGEMHRGLPPAPAAEGGGGKRKAEGGPAMARVASRVARSSMGGAGTPVLNP
mmetsp:Transcript_45567/g.145029  ORF Transcript_45567/g.145029 Transcript_45567/m.145029 type:complete len:473 (-) Transcript_45567:824-2242(-)